MEESLQARVSLEQILSLPELKVPAPQPPSATPSEVTWSLFSIPVFCFTLSSWVLYQGHPGELYSNRRMFCTLGSSDIFLEVQSCVL